MFDDHKINLFAQQVHLQYEICSQDDNMVALVSRCVTCWDLHSSIAIIIMRPWVQD